MKNRKAYFLITLLLILSGDPAFYQQEWAKYGYIATALTLIFIYWEKLNVGFYRNLLFLVSGFVILFIIQYFNLGSWPLNFIFGFLIKMVIGAIIFGIIGEKFSFMFYNIMKYVCLISLPFYLIHLLFGDDVLSSFFLHDDSKTIGLYTFRPKAPIESTLRNSGMFWEPGAFQGYINLCLFLNFKNMPYLLKHKKSSLLIILLAFITTQSTTGYLLFAFLIGFYYLFYTNINKVVSTILVGFLFCIGLVLFNSLDFLGAKIESQYSEALGNEGEYDPRRMGALLFDLHYIIKNPITGNGFQPETRYADHPALIEMVKKGENIRHGNGFSNFLASAGFFGLFWYFYVLIKYMKKYSLKDALLLVFIITMLSQGEDFFRFPFFLGIAFLIPIRPNTFNAKNSRFNYLFQQEGNHDKLSQSFT